jgi:predicted acyl esterase
MPDMNRSHPVIACVLVLLAFAAHRPVSVVEHSSDSDAAWMTEHYTKYEHRITMRDGIRLFTHVYIPKDDSEG